LHFAGLSDYLPLDFEISVNFCSMT